MMPPTQLNKLLQDAKELLEAQANKEPQTWERHESTLICPKRFSTSLAYFSYRTFGAMGKCLTSFVKLAET